MGTQALMRPSRVAFIPKLSNFCNAFGILLPTQVRSLSLTELRGLKAGVSHYKMICEATTLLFHARSWGQGSHSIPIAACELIARFAFMASCQGDGGQAAKHRLHAPQTGH